MKSTWLALHSPRCAYAVTARLTFSMWASSAIPYIAKFMIAVPPPEAMHWWPDDRVVVDCNCGHFRSVWSSQMTKRAITNLAHKSEWCGRTSERNSFAKCSSHMFTAIVFLTSFEGQQQIRNAMSNVPRLTLLEGLLQGDPSRCSLGVLDIKTSNVNKEQILTQNLWFDVNKT